MTEKEQNRVMNIAVDISVFCNGDYSRSMPVSQDDFDLIIKYEKLHDGTDYKEGIGSISYWTHVEKPPISDKI